MYIYLILIYFVYVALRIYLNFAEISHVQKMRTKKAVILSEENFKKAAEYKIANERFAIVSGVYEFILMSGWIFYGLNVLQDLLNGFSPVLQSVLFLNIFIIINYFLSLPFDIYNTFKKDKKFGFSTIDTKTFITDQVKSGALFLVFGSLVFGLLSWIILSFSLWWIWGFGLIFTLLIVINLIYPTFIAPLFNKFKPLEDKDLSSSIAALLNKAGLNSDGVFSIDASKRDNRLNAFFGGLGKSKRVVLYDTLLKKVSKEELLAVLGHELGHFKHNDIVKKIALIGTLLFIAFGFFGNLPDFIYDGLHLAKTPQAVIIFFMMFSSILFFFFTPLIGYFSRHDEYEADKYGSECESKEALANALIKLADENKSFPYSHPLNIIFYHTHPPLVERLKALGVDFSEA